MDPTKVEGRRISAWTIDLMIFLAMSLGILFATGGVSWRTVQFDTAQDAIDYCDTFDTQSNSRACVPFEDEAWVIDVAGSADGVWLFYTITYVVMQGMTGGSPGKLMLGLRVVDVHGRKAGIGKSFLRTLLWVVDAITCGIPVLGGILLVSTNGHRRVGDMAAGTFVVRKESVGTPIVLPPRPGSYEYAYGYPPPGWAAPGYPPPGTPPAGSDPTAIASVGTSGSSPDADMPMYPATTPYDPPDPTPYVPPATFATPDTDGPHWDEARDTYIQYDRAVSAWLEWDDRLGVWRPIDQ